MAVALQRGYRQAYALAPDVHESLGHYPTPSLILLGETLQIIVRNVLQTVPMIW